MFHWNPVATNLALKRFSTLVLNKFCFGRIRLEWTLRTSLYALFLSLFHFKTLSVLQFLINNCMNYAYKLVIFNTHLLARAEQIMIHT